MRRFILTFIALFLLHGSALPFSHGLNTTFNPANFPVAQAAGTIKNLITDYSATCNGVADDTSAYRTFMTFAVAQSSPVVLDLPPGSKCSVTLDSTLITNSNDSTGVAVVKDLTIWGYGATMDMSIGFTATDSGTPALIETANAGDSSVQLITASDASLFTVGQWVCVCGLEVQHGGAPQNFEFFEYRSVTSITTGPPVLIGLSAPLQSTYLKTWPTIDVKDGPAVIIPMPPAWNASTTIYGLTLTQGSGQANVKGRTNRLVDVVVPSARSIAPISNQTFTVLRGFFNAVEFDKNNETITMDHISAGQLAFQNPSPKQMVLSNSHTTSSLNGTPQNISIINSRFDGGAAIGPSGFGAATNITSNGSYFASVQQPTMGILVSDVSFSTGTFTVAKTSPNRFNVMVRAVPGYKFCFNQGGIGPCNSIPITTFTISALREDASNYYIDISNCSWGSCSGALPTPTCGGPACTAYMLYAAQTITQTNNQAGSADMTPYAAPP